MTFLDMAFNSTGVIVFTIGLVLLSKINYGFRFFLQRSSIRGLLIFFGGFLLILFGASFFGTLLEIYGLVCIFGGVLPISRQILSAVPGLSNIEVNHGLMMDGVRRNHRPDAQKRILVVGLSGAGKSTLIYHASKNKLPEAMIHSGARGNPMKCQEYSDIEYIWCDTAGFGETQQGAWKTHSAILELIRFLKSQRKGFHLAIFVARRGRVSNDLQKTYKIFNTLLPTETTRVLVYTHDSFDYGTDKWFSNGIAEISESSPRTNRQYLESNQMEFSAGLGVDFPLIPSDARDIDRQSAVERQKISRDELRKFVKDYCSRNAVSLYNTKATLRRLFEKALKAIVTIFTLNFQTYHTETELKLKDLGMEADQVAEAVHLLESD